jgi:hypothetical protein
MTPVAAEKGSSIPVSNTGSSSPWSKVQSLPKQTDPVYITDLHINTFCGP